MITETLTDERRAFVEAIRDFAKRRCDQERREAVTGQCVRAARARRTATDHLEVHGRVDLRGDRSAPRVLGILCQPDLQ